MSSSVEHLELASGLEISRVLTGLWQVADMERGGKTLDPEATAKHMKPYVDAGLTTFDMADHYGSSEVIAGYFQKGFDGKAPELLTKWVPKPGRLARADVREAVERALGRLQVERLDLLQYHAWNYADPSWLDGLFHLDELRHEGLIHHLGVTNFDTAHLRLVLSSGISVVTNQICFSLLDRRARSGMLELCRQRGVHVLAFGTLGGGLLTERWLGRPEPDWDSPERTWSEMKYGRFLRIAGGWDAFQALLRTVETIARRHEVSMANIACRYVLDQPGVGGVIVGARLGESEHLDDTLHLFDFELDAASHSQLDAAVAELDPIPGDCGDEYRKPPFLTASGDLSHHLEAMPPPYSVEEGDDGRRRVATGTVWEDLAGYCRALRRGSRVLVSGTTATHSSPELGSRTLGGSDAAAQAHFIIDKIAGAIESLGGRLGDVVRTRVFVRDIADWEAVARAHGERFGEIRPANTLVEARLVGEDQLVEIEAEAEIIHSS